MIVCKQCGHHNEDNDTFCGSCGKFLEWTGERVVVAEPEPPPPPAPEPQPEPARVGLFDRVKQAVGIDEADPAATAEPAPPPPASTTPVAPAAPAASAPSPAHAAPVASATTAPEPVLAAVGAATAAPGLASPQQDEPASRRPTSVAPTAARSRPARHTIEAPTHRLQPGDLICGQCGEGNDPTRHFCRRCGSSLDEAIAVRLPWYRRFFNRLFGVKTREAGWRPRRVGPPNVLGGAMRIFRIVLAVMILLAVLGIAAVPSFRTLVVDKVSGAVTRVVHIVRPSYGNVYATGAGASTSTAGHLPGQAVDKFNNTYWAAQAKDRSPTLTLTFAEPQDLAQIGFDSGATGSAPADAFLAQPRPHTVHLVFSNGTAADLTLKDQDATKAQFYPIDAKQVKSVEIHVTSVYAPAGASPSSVAITEVEFLVKN